MSKIMSIDAAPTVALRLLGTSQILTIVGSTLVERLKHYLLFQFVRGERRAQFICADNRIDVYLLARLARSEGLDDEEVLSSVELSRAFTAYQLCELVLRLDESLTGQLIVISDPCALFFDDDLKSLEAARHFYRMLWHIVELTSRGMRFLITHRPVADSYGRSYLSRDLLRASEAVLHLTRGGHSLVVDQNESLKGRFIRSLPPAAHTPATAIEGAAGAAVVAVAG